MDKLYSKVTAVYFSPTGGSRKYAEAISRGIDENFAVIDLTDRKNRNNTYVFGSEDLVVFGAPVYAGRLPLLPEGLFRNLEGNGAAAVISVTYGNREFDDALLEMKDLCEQAGFNCIGAAAFLAQHTYTDKLAGGRPDQKDLEEAECFGKTVRELLEKQQKEAGGEMNSAEREDLRFSADSQSSSESVLKNRLRSMDDIPGNRPYKECGRMPKHTETADFCSECGLCAKICPAGAITYGAGMEADGELCIGCLACVKNCPRGARFVKDPGLLQIREKLEPAFGGIYKENIYFID